MKIAFLVSILILAGVLALPSSCNAADRAQYLRSFERLIRENIAGQAFQNHSYLSESWSIGKRMKRYEGKLNDIKVKLDVLEGRKICSTSVETGKDIGADIQPAMVEIFGTPTRIEGLEEQLRWGGALGDAELKRPLRLSGFLYNKKLVSAEIISHGRLKAISGNTIQQPHTIYRSNLKTYAGVYLDQLACECEGKSWLSDCRD